MTKLTVVPPDPNAPEPAPPTPPRPDGLIRLFRGLEAFTSFSLSDVQYWTVEGKTLRVVKWTSTWLYSMGSAFDMEIQCNSLEWLKQYQQYVEEYQAWRDERVRAGQSTLPVTYSGLDLATFERVMSRAELDARERHPSSRGRTNG